MRTSPRTARTGRGVLADAGLGRVESLPQNLLPADDLLHDLRLLIRGVPARADSG